MSFILPSRARPHNVARLIEHWHYTDASAPVCLYLDSDDKTLTEYQTLDLPQSWGICVRPRAVYNPVWHINNVHFTKYPEDPWYGHINDDMVPRTYHWDQELIREAGADYIAYGDDMLQGKRMCTFPVIGGDLVRGMGGLMFDGLNIDSAWMLLGFKYGLLRYRPDVRLEHMHWTVGKAPYDDTYNVPEDVRQGGSCEALEAFMRSRILPDSFRNEQA